VAFENWKNKGNELLNQAINNNLAFKQLESLVLRAIENYKNAPIYDQGTLVPDRCSSINKNLASAYMYLIKSAAGENQAKFEDYIKKFIECSNLALYHGGGCKNQEWMNVEIKKASELSKFNS
jgi:hypothetical protein